MGGRDSQSLTLDAGALIAIEGADRRVGVLLKRALERGARIIVPAGALAQVWRNDRRQARLAALLEDAAVIVEAIDAELAKAAGELCGRRKTGDIVDSSVVLTGRRYGSIILSSDLQDLRKLDPKLNVVQI